MDRRQAGDRHLGVALPAGSAVLARPFMLGLTHCALLSFIQGAWSIVPLSHGDIAADCLRGFPRLACQTGNFIAAANANIQIRIAVGLGGNYALVLASTVAVMAAGIAPMAIIGPKPGVPGSVHTAHDRELCRRRPAFPRHLPLAFGGWGPAKCAPVAAPQAALPRDKRT